MTFRAERYPADWPRVRAAIRARAEERCECAGQCGDVHVGGRCDAPNGEIIQRDARTPARWRRHEHNGVCMGEPCGAVQVVLTVAHIDHDESNSDPTNLLALCQRCHLRLDREDNAARRRERRERESGQMELIAKGEGR